MRKLESYYLESYYMVQCNSCAKYLTISQDTLTTMRYDLCVNCNSCGRYSTISKDTLTAMC